MPPLSLLLYDSHAALLGILVRYVEEHYGDLLTVVGAAFREADALKLARATRPQVVLLGMGDPMADSLGQIGAIRHLLPSAIIVVMSYLGAAGYAQAALDAGADAFVDKDQLKAQLVPAILEVASARAIVPLAAPAARSMA